VLYARVAMDTKFLDIVMGAEEGVGKADEFTGTLWRGWKRIREHGVPAQVGLRPLSQGGALMAYSRCTSACLDRIICCMLPKIDLR
jgi:hypothetical protein